MVDEVDLRDFDIDRIHVTADSVSFGYGSNTGETNYTFYFWLLVELAG